VKINDRIKKQLYSIKTGKKTSGDLTSVLFQDIEEDILQLSKLTIIPDQLLLKLPFESLTIPKTNKLIIEHLAINYHYSIATWYSSKKSKAKTYPQNPILAIAPVFSDNLNINELSAYYNTDNTRSETLLPLLSSKDEILGISELFSSKKLKPTVLIGSDASEENTRKLINQYNIVHIASHAMVNTENPERSGIYFNCSQEKTSDSFFSLGEVTSENIQANLVVLSSCNSAIGDIIEGEGIIALPRGFIQAGVPNVIASLWKVHDEKTKNLMLAFYKHLLEKKLSYPEALRQAKLDCIKLGFLPIDWAGFILIGIE
jgi:CHAT domain-containing protein